MDIKYNAMTIEQVMDIVELYGGIEEYEKYIKHGLKAPKEKYVKSTIRQLSDNSNRLDINADVEENLEIRNRLEGILWCVDLGLIDSYEKFKTMLEIYQIPKSVYEDALKNKPLLPTAKEKIKIIEEAISVK